MKKATTTQNLSEHWKEAKSLQDAANHAKTTRRNVYLMNNETERSRKFQSSSELGKLYLQRLRSQIESGDFTLKKDRSVVTKAIDYKTLYRLLRKEFCKAFPQKTFSTTKNDVEMYKILSFYFSGNQRFEHDTTIQTFDGSPPKLHKGILLIGPPGLGKTVMMNLIHRIGKQQYWNEEQQQYIKFELHHPILHKTTAPILTQDYDRELSGKGHDFTQMTRKANLLIDDIGREYPSNFSKKNAPKYPMQAMIERQYIAFEKGSSIIHLTSNDVNPDDIRQRYGDHVFSRMSAMFNMFFWIGNDKRL